MIQDALSQVRPTSAPRRRRWLELMRKRPLFAVSLCLLFGLIFLAVAGPWIQPFDPEGLVGGRLAPPSSEHWFGTDELGRDILSRCIAGTRLSLTIGLLSSIGGVTFGGFVGGASAYWGGKADLLVQRLIDALQAIPVIILAVALVAVIGTSPSSVIIICTIAFMPGPARVIRSAVLAAKELEFVTAASALGASGGRIFFRHVMPQTLAPYLILVSLSVGAAILLESSLSFLGMGPQPPAVSWGRMLGGDSRLYIESAPWVILAPAVFLTVFVYAFNLLGDSLRDAFDPRLRGS